MTNLPLGRRAFLATSGAALFTAGRSRAAMAEPAWLAGDLEALRLRHGLPGAAALVLRAGVVVAQGVVGVRSVTRQEPILLSDPFVIGSCGKSMTATVAARLVARGVIRFETTLAEAFPELAPSMQPAYRGATLQALLSHRSGLPQALPVPPAPPWRPRERAGAGAAGDPGVAAAGTARPDLPLFQSRLHRGRRHARAPGRRGVREPGHHRAVPALGPGDRRLRGARGRGATGPHRLWAAAAGRRRSLSARRRQPGRAVPPFPARMGALRQLAPGPGTARLLVAGAAGPAAPALGAGSRRVLRLGLARRCRQLGHRAPAQRQRRLLVGTVRPDPCPGLRHFDGEQHLQPERRAFRRSRGGCPSSPAPRGRGAGGDLETAAHSSSPLPCSLAADMVE